MVDERTVTDRRGNPHRVLWFDGKRDGPGYYGDCSRLTVGQLRFWVDCMEQRGLYVAELEALRDELTRRNVCELCRGAGCLFCPRTEG